MPIKRYTINNHPEYTRDTRSITILNTRVMRVRSGCIFEGNMFFDPVRGGIFI